MSVAPAPADMENIDKRGKRIMAKVFRIGYLEFNSANIGAEMSYYQSVIGATMTDQAADGTRYLSLGLDHHNVALRPAAVSAVGTIGWQAGRDMDLARLARDLGEAGVPAVEKTDSRPGIGKLLAADVCGYQMEFYADMAMPAPGFAASGITPNRLGHIALLSPEAPRLIKFFDQTLGFHTTDWFEDVATFLTCNHDHHVLNIIGAPINKLHHIAFEMRGGGHQYQASDMLAKAGLPIVWGPSRHTAGHNYASYHYDPDHTLVELYADMDVYLPDLGIFEPRPWHEDMPQRPRIWPLTELNAWHTGFNFDFQTA
jgi:catechol-2,3-dioxygenase